MDMSLPGPNILLPFARQVAEAPKTRQDCVDFPLQKEKKIET